MLIDTHCHLYAEEFDADRSEVLERARQAGVAAVLLPNINEESIERMHALCAAAPDCCFPMMGLHPEDLPPDPSPLLDRMEQLLATGRYIAVGEVGIDLYWDASRRAEQIAVFRRQVEAAVRFRLPLVIHSRNAHREIVETLSPFRERLFGGVFHCFGGTADEARELLAFPDFCLGIGGVLTFKKSTLPAILAAAVPLSRVVIETDAPYLSPVPYRGRRNEPARLTSVVERLAEVYDTDAATVARATSENALRLFKKIKGSFAE